MSNGLHKVGLAKSGTSVDEQRIIYMTRCLSYCKCCGMWKVYGDEKEEVKLFCKYKKCAEIYQHCFSCGRALVQMTVCA